MVQPVCVFGGMYRKTDRGDTSMNAKELIRQVNEEKSSGWKNSSIHRSIEIMMEHVAAHYETCEECSNAFNDTDYEEETLVEMEEYFIECADLNEWICFGD